MKVGSAAWLRYGHSVDGSEIQLYNHRLDGARTCCKQWDIHYQPQLVTAGFLNDQQYQYPKQGVISLILFWPLGDSGWLDYCQGWYSRRVGMVRWCISTSFLRFCRYSIDVTSFLYYECKHFKISRNICTVHIDMEEVIRSLPWICKETNVLSPTQATAYGTSLGREKCFSLKGLGCLAKWWDFQFFALHPGKLTWNLKITCLKRKIIFQTSIFAFHVNFHGVPRKLGNGPLRLLLHIRGPSACFLSTRRWSHRREVCQRRTSGSVREAQGAFSRR